MTLLGRWFRSLGPWLKTRMRTVLIVAGVAFLTTLFCRTNFRTNIPGYAMGEIATRDFKAPTALRVIDDEQTARARSLAAERVPEVYDLDSQGEVRARADVVNAFNLVRGQSMRAVDALRPQFEKALGTTLTAEEWNFLKRTRFHASIERLIQQLLAIGYDYWITTPGQRPKGHKIVLRDVQSGQEIEVDADIYQQKVITLEQLRQTFREGTQIEAKLVEPLPASVDRVLLPLVAKLLDVTFVRNAIETKARKDEAGKNVEATWVDIFPGEMIIREGERVDRSTSMILKMYQDQSNSRIRLSDSILFFLFIFLLIFVFYFIGRRNFRKFRLSFHDQWVMGGFFICCLALIKSLNFMFKSAAGEVAIGDALIFMLPLSFPGMTLRLFTSIEILTFFSILLSLAYIWILPEPYWALVALCVSLFGASFMRHIKQRLDVFRAGLAAGALKACLVCLGIWVGFLKSPGFSSEWANYGSAVLLCISSGVFASALVLAVQPIIEYLGYTTDLRLMELSSTNHPLLRELILKAPGTYFHSFTVGQLAEKAAEAIHANGLFARVASLYHDIGKTKKPQFFIENIKGENQHDHLAPTMSAMIISNHVRDGIDLGFEYHLPQSMIEIIPQHHGTALISYFYDKAKKQSHGEAVDDRDFRYPGPKPQTREAAIILLADAVEATAKSLSNRDSDELRRAIHATIQRFFLDGQLDECELSLKDLNQIAQAFFEVLEGVYHQRIDYPHLKDNPHVPFGAPQATSK